MQKVLCCGGIRHNTGSGFFNQTDYDFSNIFGSGSDLDIAETFRIRTEYQISIFAQHWPIYTEELPGVAARDSLFVLLRPGVAMPSRARAQNYPTQQK